MEMTSMTLVSSVTNTESKEIPNNCLLRQSCVRKIVCNVLRLTNKLYKIRMYLLVNNYGGIFPINYSTTHAS